MGEQFASAPQALGIRGTLRTKIVLGEPLLKIRLLQCLPHEPLPPGIPGIRRTVFSDVGIAVASAEYMRRYILRPRGEGGVLCLHECRCPFVNDSAIGLSGVNVNAVFLEISDTQAEQITSP